MHYEGETRLSVFSITPRCGCCMTSLYHCTWEAHQIQPGSSPNSTASVPDGTTQNKLFPLPLICKVSVVQQWSEVIVKHNQKQGFLIKYVQTLNLSGWFKKLKTIPSSLIGTHWEDVVLLMKFPSLFQQWLLFTLFPTIPFSFRTNWSTTKCRYVVHLIILYILRLVASQKLFVLAKGYMQFTIGHKVVWHAWCYMAWYIAFCVVLLSCLDSRCFSVYPCVNVEITQTYILLLHNVLVTGMMQQ